MPLAVRGRAVVVRLGELVVILDLHRQGLSVSAIAQRTGLDRKTVRKYIAAGLEPPAYGPRQPRPTKVVAFHAYLRERVAAYPELTGARLHREIGELGYGGGQTAVKEFLREVRPSPAPGFEVRFETPPGRQAQVASRPGESHPQALLEPCLNLSVHTAPDVWPLTCKCRTALPCPQSSSRYRLALGRS